MTTADTADYKNLFLTTARDHVNQVRLLLSDLSHRSPNEVFREIFRHAHSLKGSSSVMGHQQISILCSKIDDLINLSENQNLSLNEKADKIGSFLDQIELELNSISQQS